MVWLLNWLWQGVLLTAGVAAALACARRLNAATRERIWWTALVAVLGLPLVGSIRTAAAARSHAQASILGMAPLVELPQHLPVWTSLVWVLWMAWTTIWCARLAGSLFALSRASRRVTPFPSAEVRSLRRWRAISAAAGASGPPLVISGDVVHAAVIGLFRPSIAISPTAARALSADELDQLIVHEYAHVCRRDHVAILIQRIAWAAAGIHPALWWIDRALTLEREVACDDWVLAHAVGARTYGSCLVKLASRGVSAGWSAAPGASLSRSQLAARIVRLLDPLRNASVRRSPAALAAATCVIFVAAAVGSKVRVFGRAGVPALGQSIAMVAGVELPSTQDASSIASSASPALTVVPARPQRRARVEQAPEAIGLSDLSRAFDLETPGTLKLAAPATVPQTVAPLDTPPFATTLPEAIDFDVTAEPAEQPHRASAERSLWMHAADVGVAVGDGARVAGVKTGGFFTRFGRSIAGAF